MLFNLSLKSLEFMINSFIPGIITSSSYPKRSKHINKGVEEDKAYTTIKIKFIKSLNVSNLHQINLSYHEILSVKPIFPYDSYPEYDGETSKFATEFDSFSFTFLLLLFLFIV